MDKRGGGEFQDFLSKIFCLTVPKISVGGGGGNPLVFHNFGYRKSLDKGGGGLSRFSVEVFVSLYRNISLENTLVFQKKFLLSKIFMHRGGGASRFCRNFLSHRTKTKSFVKEPFCFPEVFWYRKKFMDKRGHITIFSRNFYVSQCRKLS